MRKLHILCLSVVMLIGARGEAQVTFYDTGTLQKIEIFFSASNWDYRLDTAKMGTDDYVLADSIRINGVHLDSVGVKYKGNSSYDSSYAKNPIHVELDTYLNQSYQSFTDIKLGNGYADPSLIREVLAYTILGNYMHAPRSNFAQVYINGQYMGLYSNTESINKQFCSDHFYSSTNTFFKCNPIVIPGPTTKSNLRYLGSDSSLYQNFYELKSNTGWSDLVALCDSVTNQPSSAANQVDMDRWIWMLAFDNVLVNLDSYMGAFCQNYYIYQDNTGRFNPIVWDLNMAFGGFPYLGSGASSLGSLTIANMQQLPHSVHNTDPYWPMITIVQNDAMYKRMYIAHIRTLLNEFFANGTYSTLAGQMQTTIDAAVQSDSRKFYTYTQFQNGMTTSYSVGSYSVPGISGLMDARVTYLQGTSELQAAPPAISNVTADNTAPALNSTVHITATVTNANANAVYLGYRYAASEKFERVLMYDDGAHQDGAAGDNVYGAPVVVASALVQYYVYAENNNAGMFAPERAEHEFYSITANVQLPEMGSVMINEFLATNQTDMADEQGQHEDWIELYNVHDHPHSLYGLYLSDSYSNPTKFAFPQTAIIPAHGFLTIWADEDTMITQSLHANFKLSSVGEQLILSDGNGMIFDSLSFGQQNADISVGRCSDGYGPFSVRPVTSYNDYNCPVGVEEQEVTLPWLVYPVPVSDWLHIETTEPLPAEIINPLGQVIWSGTAGPVTLLPVNGWSSGVYLLRSAKHAQRILVVQP